jgi:hypothetical protein
MDLPKIEKAIFYGYDGPAVFECPDLKTSFYRLRASWAPARKTPGGLCLIGEEADWRSERRKIFVLWFEQFADTHELLQKLREVILQYRIEEVYARLTRPEMDFLNFFNSDLEYRQRIGVMRPPRMEDTGCIDYHLSLVEELTRPGRQRIFFPPDSDIAALLQSVSDEPAASGIADLDHPAVASIVQGIAALYHYQTMEPEQLRHYRPPLPKPVDQISSYDPFSTDHPTAKYDAWANLND